MRVLLRADQTVRRGKPPGTKRIEAQLTGKMARHPTQSTFLLEVDRLVCGVRWVWPDDLVPLDDSAREMIAAAEAARRLL